MTEFNIAEKEIKGVTYMFHRNNWPEIGCNRYGSSCVTAWNKHGKEYPKESIGSFKNMKEAIKFLNSRTWQRSLRSDARATSTFRI